MRQFLWQFSDNLSRSVIQLVGQVMYIGFWQNVVGQRRSRALSPELGQIWPRSFSNELERSSPWAELQTNEAGSRALCLFLYSQPVVSYLSKRHLKRGM